MKVVTSYSTRCNFCTSWRIADYVCAEGKAAICQSCIREAVRLIAIETAASRKKNGEGA
jgi:hypothetical protein